MTSCTACDVHLSTWNGAADSDEERQQDLAAVCDVVSAILAVEHRSVQPHLTDIWQMLWLAAEGALPALALLHCLQSLHGKFFQLA